MDVYAASDGSLYQFDRSLTEYDSVETIELDLSSLSGIPEDHILLFLDDGKQLQQDLLQALWERGGRGAGQSSDQRQTLFLFNKETFWTEPEHWAAQLQEEVQLPPPLNLSALSDLTAAQYPFRIAYDHLAHLRSLYLSQSRALQIAYQNLFQHLKPLIDEFQSFASRTSEQLEKEETLIRGADGDLAMLPKVVIHEALGKKKERDRRDSSGPHGLSGSGAEDGKKTLADYIHLKRMESVRESCRTDHDRHVEQFNGMCDVVDRLSHRSEQGQADLARQSAESGTVFGDGLAMLEDVMEQVAHLLERGDAAHDLMELDQGMRDELAVLTGVKNDFTLFVHTHLRLISELQSEMTQILSPVKVLEDELKNNAVFPHLARLHQLPFAYTATVVEVVRRKDFASWLSDWAGRLEETLKGMVTTERKRRMDTRAETIGFLPWTIPGLEESMMPSIRVTVDGGADSLQGIDIGMIEVQNLLAWVSSLKADPDVTRAVQEGDPNPVEFLENGLLELVRQLDYSQAERSAALQQALSPIPPATSGHGTSASHTLADIHAGHEQEILGIKADHERHLRSLEDQHEQRTDAWQSRQAELQEEVMRLRNDLSEEMLARQALSAELEDRARTEEDKARERQEHSDLVSGFQADLAQEKERAKDLGVRLQEALLDVDGLRNAESTLSVQLQAARDERSKTLQSLSDAQARQSTLESQLAGVRAELESANSQLVEARAERDTALRNQSAEAERMMRDHIAETDGDRAILEHQNVELAQQLESLKLDSEEKLSTARNAAVRQADGLRAELQFTKAQLKDVQRRETMLADELSTMKDAATTLNSEKSHQGDIYRDAVALTSKYHETCARLLNAINSSTTISGSTFAPPTQLSRPKSPQSAVTSASGKEEMRDSVMSKSLAQATAFDIAAFAESVQRTINLVKKWSKSCKSYRDSARNRIAFTAFQRGDLALFLPTRNAAAKSWAAFNVSAPHNFLKMTPAMEEQSRTREWIIARIVKTDEALATGGDSPSTNPFGLADGLRYYVHHVEEYVPTVVRQVRRSTSAGYPASVSDSRMQSRQSDSVPATSRKNTFERPEDMATPFTPGQAKTQTSYFPSTSCALQTSPINETRSPPGAYPHEAEDDQPFKDEPLATDAAPPSPPGERPPLSPVSEIPPNLPFARPAATLSARPTSAAHRRTSSRNSNISQTSHPIFAPGSLGRPASVASGHSGTGLGTSIGKTAPAMAVTTSDGSSASPSGSVGSGIPELSRRVLRRPSSTSLSTQPEPIMKASPSKPSPLGASPPVAGSAVAKTAPTSPGGFAALGTGSMRLIRGFSTGKKAADLDGVTARERKPSATDMLKRLGSS